MFFDFPPRLVARSQAIVAEGMEALGQDGILSLHLRSRGFGHCGQNYRLKLNHHLAGGTGQGLFVLPDLLLENLIHVGGHLDLLQTLTLPLQDGRVLLKGLIDSTIFWIKLEVSPAFSSF